MTSSSLVKRVMAAVVLGMTGLTMLLYALETTSLTAFGASDGGTARPPLSIYLTLFVGLALVSLSACWALQQWSTYLREHVDVKQLPVWFLTVLMVAPGAALVYSFATHAGYIRGLDQVPADPSLGYVAFQAIMAALVIIALVVLAARWTPGYKRPPQSPTA